ncbi:MAG: hypothetical protein ACK4GR_05750, partial [bacterium]
LFELNNFTDIRKVDKLSKDVDTPTHFNLDRVTKSKPSIVDYIRISYNLKNYVIQGSFDVLEKNENPDVLVASDHRPVSVSFNIFRNLETILINNIIKEEV